MTIPKVLLVNDDPASLYALESLLADSVARQLYQVVTATSGKEALREVLRQEFAVILLDVSMPAMDGFETAEAIHSHPRSAGVPIIFITAHYADEINRLKGYLQGAADYLFTPVIPQILHAKIAVFVELTKKNLLLRQQAEELARLNEDLRVQRLHDLERINGELELEIKERKLAEQRANELSTRDALTNLLNRRALIQHLEHAVAASDRHGTGFALLFLDLDKFKAINDQHGHETGDELLRQVAARLSAAVRVADVVARLGGDEFVVLIEGQSATANAARVANKIEQACALTFDIGGSRVKTAASIGIAIYPQDGADAQALMKNADTAMYHAKQSKSGPVQFFHEALNVRERERAQWALELRRALAAEELELRYQPQVDIRSGNVTGAEALLYWRHPRLGELEAAQFLPHLHERALLEQIDDWVIRQACLQATQLKKAAAPTDKHKDDGDTDGRADNGPCIWINLTAPQPYADLAQHLLPTLRKHGLAPGSVGLELSAGLTAGAGEAATAALRELQAAGVRIALDNFGSSLSSLAECQRLRPDVLKIDRSFVQAIGDDAGSGAELVAAMLHLARALTMRGVALGVAGQQQLDVLQALGCDCYQGELFSAPLPGAGLAEQLRRRGAPPDSAQDVAPQPASEVAGNKAADKAAASTETDNFSKIVKTHRAHGAHHPPPPK